MTKGRKKNNVVHRRATDAVSLQGGISSADIEEYSKAHPGIPLQDLAYGEKILIDISEPLGRFLAIGGDVEVLQEQQRVAMQSYANDQVACIDWYRRLQKDCQAYEDIPAEFEKLRVQARSGNKSDVQKYSALANSFQLLALLHQTIYDKPMKVFRRDDVLDYASRGKHPSGGARRPDHVRQPNPENSNEPSCAEEPFCNLRRNGAVNCTLSSDMKCEDSLFLDMGDILRVPSLVLVQESQVQEASHNYQQLLDSNKKQAQAAYRSMYASCLDFLNLRNQKTTREQWETFRDDCIGLVALREILHKKEVPYFQREEFKATCQRVAQRMMPDREFTAIVLGDKSDASTSRQPAAAAAAAGQKDVGSTSSGASGSGGFVRSAKAQELYGKMCLLGDEYTKGANIQFKDIAKEPDITLFLQYVLGKPMACLTNGTMLTDLCVKARHMCQVDRQGAEILCKLLLDKCMEKDPIQLMDHVKIGNKKAYEDYEELMQNCMFHMVLKCVIEGVPILAMIGREHLPTFKEADVVVRDEGEGDRRAFYFMDKNKPS